MSFRKKIIMLLSLSIFACASSFATQISFQILQQDATCDEINDKSYDLETFVLDGFFERNYIVTNSEAAIIEDESDIADLWKAGLGEAFSGSSDYFVQIEVFYKADETLRKPVGMIDRIVWKLATVRTGVVIETQEITNIVKKANGSEDLGAISRTLVKNINNSLKA